MTVFCIDLKSFYASVECALRGLDPFETKLVVADKERGPGSIVLAVTPKLKSMGVPSRCRIYELPKDEEIIFAKPRMKKYIEFSTKIYKIYLNFVSKEDIHVYSIDEAFLDLTSYLKYYGKAPEEIAQAIIDAVYKETRITASCGIGENMFLAKVALDILAKESPNHIACINQEIFRDKIWKVEPLTKIWGIGGRLEKRLRKMGIKNLADLAHTPLERLEKEFGIVGRELLEHAFGIERTTVQEARNYIPESRSFGRGQVLYEDYDPRDLEVVLIET
ncbi:MAG TPA: damage repair protein, partial [Acholeplasmataceae bacterium]|nr:damage repair protein [Acholeplasmataceae bacterium]